MKCGGFYIIDGVVYPCFEDSLGHADFWQRLVRQLFSGKLDSDTFSDLVNAPYSCDRGRVTNLDGEIIVHGTSGCKPYLDAIKKTYGIKNAKVLIGTDPHYHIVKPDALLLKDVIRMISSAAIKPKPLK